MADKMVCPTFKFRWLREPAGAAIRMTLQQQFSIVDLSGKEHSRMEWRDIPTEDADEVRTAD